MNRGSGSTPVEVPERENWIGGRGRFAINQRPLIDCVSPHDGSVVARYPDSDAADVDVAVRAAAEAQPGWARTPLAEREGTLLDAAGRVERAAEEIGRVMAAEMAKPLAEAMGEAKRAAAVLRFAAGEARRPVGSTFESDDPDTFLYTVHRPVGVVGLITPWNFPVAIPAWKLAPALAYGNALVLKPASHAPGAVLLLARCLTAAGLPDGVLNVVIGGGTAVGEPLCSHPDVAVISYTGSGDVGASVRERAAGAGKRVQLELGGQNPAVVLADANLWQAASEVVAGAFGGAGQKCTATRRAIVDQSVAAEFRELSCERASGLVVGDPFREGTSVSALIDADAVADFERAIEKALADGADVVFGGGRHRKGVPEAGNYVTPTILDNVDPASEFACTEVFAPLLGLIEVDGFERALEVANGVRYGLSASVFTRDLDAARCFASRVEAGLVHINSQTAGADVHVPFGGTKESGYGPREQGRAARELYTESTTIYMSPAGGTA